MVVRLKNWDADSKKRPEGVVVSILDEEDTNDLAMKEILLEKNWPFPGEGQEVKQENPPGEKKP